ncbi:MAG: cytochrome c peroxidase [Geobacteraceae bacterium]|nr:cytochrome c peroxidase [Geobacteraceae bacterium]
MSRTWMMCVLILLVTAQSVLSASLPPKEELGKLLYFDTQLSREKNQSCATCHQPPGFADPANAAMPQTEVVSKGSVSGLFGTRNSPTVAYAAFSPHFRWDSDEGLFLGGQFWDGREVNLKGQAKGPFLNPVEMTMPDGSSVVDSCRNPLNPQSGRYLELFRKVYGVDLAQANLKDPIIANALYDLTADAIAAYEKSREVNQFSSKFDHVLAGKARFTPQENLGLKLFNGKGLCSKCHISEAGKSPGGGMIPPLFTDFTYDNLGIPRSNNPALANAPVDLGLGGRPDIAAIDPKGLQKGKFKVPTLRNVSLTAPYGHNGYFATLTEIVEFYNTAGVRGRWPEPEVPQNVNRKEMGNLKLTKKEVAAIVAFMGTLTDGYGQPLEGIVLPPFP